MFLRGRCVHVVGSVSVSVDVQMFIHLLNYFCSVLELHILYFILDVQTMADDATVVI